MPERPASPSPVQLTDRDVEILRWLARFRGVTAAQIGRRFDMGYSRVSRRLNQLGAGGLVALTRVLHRKPGLYTVTGEGQTAAGADLPVAAVGLGAYEHDVAVADVAIAAERAGDTVLTQRQMQALEAGAGAGDLTYAVARTAGERHFPDLVLDRSDGRWALEVEVTDARSELLEAILRAYAGAAHLAGVIFTVAPAVHADRIQRAAAALELGLRFELRVLEAPAEDS
ncbi:MAG: MarR family transcriptional regulator [Actinobacteria bacterium]|nr:MarR family transcriptional regulator [Actinomycetota bacterium]